MNKAQLIEIVNAKTELTKKASEEVVNLVFEEMKAALLKGESVKVSGFGTFEVKTRKQRVGTSPSSGQKITIPQTKTIGFKVSKNFKGDIK